MTTVTEMGGLTQLTEYTKAHELEAAGCWGWLSGMTANVAAANTLRRVLEGTDPVITPFAFFTDPQYRPVIMALRRMGKAVQGALFAALIKTDHSDKTPLMQAAEAGNVEQVKILLAIAEENHSEATLLKQAIKKEEAEYQGKTALMLAIEKNHVDIVQLLLERAHHSEALLKELLLHKDVEDNTPLMQAIDKRHAKLIPVIVASIDLVVKPAIISLSQVSAEYVNRCNPFEDYLKRNSESAAEHSSEVERADEDWALKLLSQSRRLALRTQEFYTTLQSQLTQVCDKEQAQLVLWARGIEIRREENSPPSTAGASDPKLATESTASISINENEAAAVLEYYRTGVLSSALPGAVKQKALDDYIALRNSEVIEHTSWIGSFFNGYSKTNKIAAATEFKHVLKGEVDLRELMRNPAYAAALTQGRLGQLIAPLIQSYHQGASTDSDGTELKKLGTP